MKKIAALSLLLIGSAHASALTYSIAKQEAVPSVYYDNLDVQSLVCSEPDTLFAMSAVALQQKKVEAVQTSMTYALDNKKCFFTGVEAPVKVTEYSMGRVLDMKKQENYFILIRVEAEGISGWADYRQLAYTQQLFDKAAQQ